MEPIIKLNYKHNCRVCLEEAENMISIFVNGDNKSIASKISECGGIEIENSIKDYPDKICPKCMTCLNIAYKFRTTCQNTDNLLKSLIGVRIGPVILSETATDPLSSVAFKQRRDDMMKIEKIEIEEYVLNEEQDANHNDDDDDDDFYHMYKNSIDYFENTKVQSQQYQEIKSNVLEEKIKKEESLVKQKPQPKERVSGTKRQTQKKKSNIKIDKKDSLESKVYVCEICGNIYKKKALFDNHKLLHTDEKPYKCELCGRGFKKNFKLKCHMVVHTGDKPYACGICDRKFGDQSSCIRHKRTHTGEKPYKCDICNKAFTYSYALNIHMSVHTGEKPFECRLCDKKFSRQHHLKAHLATLLHQDNNRKLLELK